MTIKARIIDALSRQPMTAREVAEAVRIDYRLAAQLVYELRDKLCPEGTRKNHRNQYAFVWKIRETV